jgi:pyrroline-5-carboxylate reductase
MVAQQTKPGHPPVIGLIGAGNMARSLAGGLIASHWPTDRLILSDPDDGQRAAVERSLGLPVYRDNRDVARQADILVFAIKPQVFGDVARELRAEVQARRPLVVSLAAGVRIADIERWLGGNLPVVRVMPNTPALVGSGAAGLFANARVTDAQRDRAEAIVRAVGVTVWVADEAQLDVVTALSGSGPAYFFLVMEALEEAAIARGLPRDQARLLALETAFGAAKMALEGADEPQKLRRQVTSPGGTTEAAIRVLEDGGLRKLFGEALSAAQRRATELGDLFGKDQ